MRGKAGLDEKVLCTWGITPAHAGKSFNRIIHDIEEEDHPRTCGEKYMLKNIFFSFLGSPPHMRGKVTFCTVSLKSGRITPAHAGKSVCVKTDIPCIEDHPRTCGEKA